MTNERIDQAIKALVRLMECLKCEHSQKRKQDRALMCIWDKDFEDGVIERCDKVKKCGNWPEWSYK